MKGDIMCFFKFFANVKKVSFTTWHHDADQCSVVRAKALQRADKVALGSWPDQKCDLRAKGMSNFMNKYLHGFV